jgi:hypothetical protein
MMRGKLKTILSALLVTSTLVIPSIKIIAVEESAADLVSKALSYKSFYHYNVAYAKVLELPETNEKYQLLASLGTIQSTVWTDEVNETLQMLTEMTKTASAKTYAEIEAYVTNSKLGQWDKDYLLGELTSWGNKLVWTEDYSKAVEAFLKVGEKPTAESLANAQKLINEVKNEYSKAYLIDQFNLVKKNYESSNSNVVNDIINLKADTNLSRDQKVEKMIAIVRSHKGIEIPEEYFTSAGMYSITDTILGWNIKETMEVSELQRNINDIIAKYEAAKLKFWLGNTKATLKENSSESDVNITAFISETISEKFLPETEIEFIEAGWKRGVNAPLEPSQYLYVKDGQVYMTTKLAPKEGYKDSISIKVSYKNGVIFTSLWVEIQPTSSDELEVTVN